MSPQSVSLVESVTDASAHHLAALALQLADPWQRLVLVAAVVAAGLIVGPRRLRS